ncbi:MAG: hypothetical protein NTV51_24530 [Verrucomicrobia bacterium]|nr:hypothetical protein [Verrucomicrobiota bacterium]
MIDEQQSASTPIGKPRKTKEMFPYGGRGGINPKHAHLTPEQRCQGHKKNGDQCKLPPILGATVCRQHGGAAPHIKAAAKARLENAADRVARQLLGMAEDPDMAPAVKLAAIKDVLDRGGLGARAALDVTHEIPLWQQVLDCVYRGPRGDAPAGPDGATLDSEVVDGEVIEYASFTDDDGREP